MTYKYYPNRAERLTVEFVKAEYATLLGRIQEAESSATAAAWLKLYSDWNALRAYIQGEGSRIHYEYAKHLDNAEAEANDKYYREILTPVADDNGSEFLKAVLESRYCDAIGERFGTYLIDQLKLSVKPMAPVNSAQRVKVGNYADQYNKILGSAEVTIQGKTITLPRARSMAINADPAIREESWYAVQNWVLEHRNPIAEIYSKMVELRTEMGRNVGFQNFVPLGYEGMGRTDYGVAESEAFRASVRKYAVPLQAKIYQSQAVSNGTATLRPWDAVYDKHYTLPTGIAPVGEQLEKAQQVFDSLSPRLGAHFMRMRNEGLIDLENRNGKMAGAFCTSFPDSGLVAILCNSVGDSGDVSTLTHEMGHAFQAWESQKIEAIELQWPTSDGAEVFSMGMEFLSMAYMSTFFSGDNLVKFRRHRWHAAIELMCYVSIVDEFQHWVYDHPEADADGRDAAWSRIWDTYRVGFDFTGLEKYKACRWYMQAHIFQTPFYYLDYAIAETGAMQFGLMAKQNLAATVDAYIKACQIGGTKSVLGLFDAVGFRSPFDPTTMQSLMKEAADVLGLDVPALAEA